MGGRWPGCNLYQGSNWLPTQPPNKVVNNTHPHHVGGHSPGVQVVYSQGHAGDTRAAHSVSKISQDFTLYRNAPKSHGVHDLNFSFIF